jgi:hypothetical protein
MTDLHFALLAAAIVVLLLLFGWSKWQERRQISRLQEQLGGPQRDLLLDPLPAAAGERIEPRLGELLVEPAAEREAPESAAAAPAEEAHPRPQLPGWTEDPLLDCVLELRCTHPADGVAVIDATAPFARLDCGLPVHVVAWDARVEQWVLPDRFGFYGELLAAIQLANRRHTLGDIEGSKFIAATQQVALTLDADFDPPELARLRHRAAVLAAQIEQFDVQIGLTLEPHEGLFSPPQVQKAMLALGLASVGDRTWVRRGAAGQPMFVVRLTAEFRVAVELDVPLADPEDKPLQVMFATAGELAALLHARVVDDHGRPIGPGSIEAIELPLQALYDKMRAAEIAPGSERARRLFS